MRRCAADARPVRTRAPCARLVDSLWLGGAAISTVVFFTAALGGLLFLAELLALRHVDAVDLAAAHTLAALVQPLVALAAAGTVASAVPMPRSWTALALLVGGAFLGFGALGAYWRLSKQYGARGRTTHRLAGCCPCLGAVEDERDDAVCRP
jgi:hypothetical protein